MRGPNGEDLPDSILFACNLNAVRSPIAAALMQYLYGGFVRVQSVGVRRGVADPFAAEVMREIGLDLGAHHARTFEDLDETPFDLVISLTPEAHHKALDLKGARAVEYWPTIDPTAFEGSREQILAAYRQVRDDLLKRLRRRFAHRPPAP